MKLDVKKFLLQNFPYVFLFWFFDRVGEGWRLAEGADVVEQAMGMVSGLGPLFTGHPLPSFHPQDLLVGLIGAVAVRLAMYFKAQNAKKYRRGVEYGSARWADPKTLPRSLIPSSTRIFCSPRLNVSWWAGTKIPSTISIKMC